MELTMTAMASKTMFMAQTFLPLVGSEETPTTDMDMGHIAQVINGHHITQGSNLNLYLYGM